MSQYFITNSILQELNKVRDIELREGIRAPLPKFLYIQRYGRRAQEQMQEILSLVGKKEWFLFKTEGNFQEPGLCRNFGTELKKHAGTGKAFRGCVLIELSKETLLKEDFAEFLEFLKEREDELYYIFTAGKSRDAVSLQKCMEQYFFVRTVYAQSYSVEEQLDMIRDICEEYGFDVSMKVRNLLTNGLKNKEWREEDHVERRLRNEVQEIIYETILEEKSKLRIVSPEMAWELLQNLQKGNVKEAAFGFHEREFEAV